VVSGKRAELNGSYLTVQTELPKINTNAQS
jgi:hypothetical protein